MAEADLVLRFEIADGQTPNAENVARALLAWIDLMKVAGEIIEPGSQLEVGLTGVEDGSDIFKLALRRMQGFGEAVQAGMAEYPLPSKAAMTLGGLIGGTVLTTTVINAITPDPRIPDDQMAVFEENNRLLEESVELQKQQMRFYGILQDEPAIEVFQVIRPYDERVIYTIPRNEFADRSGLWGGDVEDTAPAQVETRTATWDVILIKPVLVPEPRRWGFVRDGIEFDLPPAEWPRDYDSLDHERDDECRARSTSRKRLSASCVKLRLCWRRALRPLKPAAGSRSANKPIIAGARNMAA